jgi:hypothetical protein
MPDLAKSVGEGAKEPQAGRTVHLSVVLQWCYSGVTVALQWCYSGVTVVLQWCYSGVTVVLQCVYTCSWSVGEGAKQPQAGRTVHLVV